jgi:hypothetical protein
MTLILAAQIAPQRSTQYAQLASTLAPFELQLSPLGPLLSEFEEIELGGQAYLKIELEAELDPVMRYELGALAMTSGLFVYYDHIGDQAGPFLQPIESGFAPFVSPDLVMTRRYRGKTNEMFTHFLCNVARYSSDFAQRRWEGLRVMDPLAGGGTTLLTALMLGADSVGVEQAEQDVTTTIAFLRDYMRGEGIACQIKEERVQKVGQRWWATVGKTGARQLVFARGMSWDSAQLISGFKKPHLIVTDLPYGVQHQGKLVELLEASLPVWAQLLSEGGALVFAWESARLPREEMIELVESASPLKVLNTPPYDQLAHRVDRVIKARDVMVARA